MAGTAGALAAAGATAGLLGHGAICPAYLGCSLARLALQQDMVNISNAKHQSPHGQTG